MAIFLLNLLLGWTFIGWVVALVWAFIRSNDDENFTKNENSQKTHSAADELIKYSNLRDKGIITDEEFLEKKKQILNSNND